MNSNLDETLKLSLEEYEGSNTAAASGSPDAAARLQGERERQELQEATQESEMAAIQADLIASAKQVSEEDLVKKAIEASLETLPAGTHDMDFDDQVSAAIKASLGHLGQEERTTTDDGAATTTAGANDYEEQLRLALELSAQEYTTPTPSSRDWRPSRGGHAAPASSATAPAFGTPASDEDDELQRAIQASLQQS